MSNLLLNFPSDSTPRPEQIQILNDIDTAIKGKKKYIILQAPTGVGKAQPLYSKVMTPSGWVKMGDIEIGDEVLTPSGDVSRVTHIHPQGVKDIQEVIFKDGRSTKCCDDHLWRIHSHSFTEKWRTVDTIELKRQLLLKSSKVHIPLIQNIHSKDMNLLIDPYVLGCLLGDGSFKDCIRLTTADDFIRDEVRLLLNDNYNLQKINKSIYGYVIVQKKKHSNKPYRLFIDELGLTNTKSNTKFIPDIYMNGSFIQRLHLLQGLIDTDGYVGKHSSISYCTTSKELANNVIELVRSIGGICKISREFIPTCMYKGEVVKGKKAYSLSIRYKNPRDLVRLPRKRERCSKDYQYKDLKLGLDSIKSCGRDECKCITIDSKDQLYITDEYIVTHNSHIAATLAAYSRAPHPDIKDLIDSYEIMASGADGYKYEDMFLKHQSYGAAVLTVTKTLQDQYDTLFTDSDLLKGKRNYVCKVDENFDCDLAPCLLTPKLLQECKSNDTCPMLIARKHALGSKFGVFNYSSFLTLPSFLKKRQFIVCDEASELEDELVNNFSCDIEYSKLNLSELQINKLHTNLNKDAHQWLTDLQQALLEKAKEADSIFRQNKKNKKIMLGKMAKYRYYKNLLMKTSAVLQNWYKAEYITEITKDRATFTPLYVNMLAKDFFQWGDTVILMSATLIDHELFAKTLGIDKDEYVYIETESAFDPQKSPIYCDSKYKLNYKNMDAVLPIVVKKALIICKHFKTNKGIIHTHSFKITQALIKTINKDSRFLVREPGMNNEALLNEHLLRDDSTVLLSPSLGFGTDLKDDLGRFSIIMKTPYLPLSSERIKRLAKRDQRWYDMKALVNLVQMCGRTTRSVDDYSDTFILDATALDLIKRNKNKIPRWFLKRLH